MAFSLASLSFTSPANLLVALALLAAGAVAIWIRRPGAPRGAGLLCAAGGVLLAAAAGGICWLSGDRGQVLVMVDLSPSTRTAQFRDRAWLERRIGQLLGDVPHRVLYFASDQRNQVDSGPTLADFPADRTTFAPPPARAVVLLSDGRFELAAAAPPVFAVVDPVLLEPGDGAVSRLEIRGNTVWASVAGSARSQRDLTIDTGQSLPTTRAFSGDSSVWVSLPQSASTVSARLSPGDAWPENDALAARVPAPLASQRWWVGGASPPNSWMARAAMHLPTDAAAYLAPSIVILDNVPAADLSTLQQQRIVQYVRDLGGALLVLGGDRAFAAGGYAGSAIETLCPLASVPPAPTIHWIVLMDASGSMSSDADGSTRWDLEKQAVLRLLPQLPPDDPLTIGSFSDELRWWSVGRSVGQTSAMRLPPADVSPSGPTNLQPALLKLIAQTESALPKHVLLLTDAQTRISDAADIARGLAQRKIALHVLAIAPGGAVDVLQRLAAESGGQFLQSFEPRAWAQAIERLARGAAPDRIMRTRLGMEFTGELAGMRSQVDLWNRTWLKTGATLWADAAHAGERVPVAARWSFGQGTVVAIAAPISASEVEPIVRLIARPPRDPRFAVHVDAGPKLLVRVDAMDGQTALNGLRLTLDLWPPPLGTSSHTVGQSAPGRYELVLDSPRRPMVATVRHEGRPIDRFAVPGRYAPEFDAIGIDAQALDELARRTGGRVIQPDQARPIDFGLGTDRVGLWPWFAATGAVFIAAALVRWKVA